MGPDKMMELDFGPGGASRRFTIRTNVPRMITTSEDFGYIDPVKRECNLRVSRRQFFSREFSKTVFCFRLQDEVLGHLKILPEYSEVNCELECAWEEAADTCGCAPW